MELQFNKMLLQCLQPVIRQAQTQEQTQEVRLPEGMPDIGRVIACWAQVVVRGKEWRSDKIGVNGGVMAWVLYAPEDGGTPQGVAAWLPYQMKWDIPETRHDGTILAQPFLRSVDARSLSARKLMVRANLGILAEAMVPGEVELSSPGELPEDVRLLKRTYPMRIPREAGEKAFQMEEDLVIPGSMPQLEQMIRYELRPELIDQKLMADKTIFRGAAILHMLYRAADGQLHSWDQEIPFSQYADLDREYDADASVRVTPVVTNLELDLGQEGQLRLKAGLTGQYVVYDCPMVELVEDAYSPNRRVTPQMSQLQLPAVLDEQTETLRAEQTVEADAMRVMDVAFSPDTPQQMRSTDGVEVQLPGMFQLLYTDSEGAVQSANAHWEQTRDLQVSSDASVETTMTSSGKPQASPGGNAVTMQADMVVDMRTNAQQGIPMVTGLELGELTEPDPNRPSLILRRAGNDTLWDIAKDTGSTVEGIRAANNLVTDPDSNQILLIPVS